MQAAMASLFEDSLENVPNFIEFGGKWFDEIWKYIHTKGYTYNGCLYNGRTYVQEEPVVRECNFSTLASMDGINGYFYATVYSPKFYSGADKNPTTHAVIIDKDFNIVHHVNKAYDETTKYPLADEIGYNGIIKIWIIEPCKY